VTRLRAGEWVAGAGALLLIASLWAGPPVLAVLLLLLALPALALPVTQATRRSPAVPVLLAVLAVVTGAIALILALLRLPGTATWLGVAGALGALAGGWLSMRTERVPGAGAPHVPRRPAPPAA
jgi:hypothetical protein